jgi:hypothetical protein
VRPPGHRGLRQTLLRADTDALLAAYDAWERIGPRYERATTSLLVPR